MTKIDNVSKNLNPLDFWGCLGWKEIADGLEWSDRYDDNTLYLLITNDFETPVIALFTSTMFNIRDENYGGMFTVYYHSVIEHKYYYYDCDDIQYVAEMPASAEVIESIKALCNEVDNNAFYGIKNRDIESVKQLLKSIYGAHKDEIEEMRKTFEEENQDNSNLRSDSKYENN